MRHFRFVSAALLFLFACGAFETANEVAVEADAGANEASSPDAGSVPDAAQESGVDAGPPRTLVVLGGAELTASDRTFYGTIEPSGIKWIEGARLPTPWFTGCAHAFADSTVIVSGANSTVFLEGAQQPGTNPLAAWVPGPGLSKPRKSAGCVDVPNGLVVVGGGNLFSSAQYVDVDIGMASDGGVAWKAGPSLPDSRQDVAGVYTNDYVYSVGGYPCTKNILAWNPTGESAWKDAGALPLERYGAAVAAHGNRVFVIGGDEGSICTSTTTTSSVLALTVEDGRVTAVASERVLPEARTLHRAAVVGSNLYVLGGRIGSGTSATASVMRAPIDANGALGPWVFDTPLPMALAGFALAVR